MGKVKITVEVFEKFKKVKESGGSLENYKDAGLSLGEIHIIACGYDLLKKLYEFGMLENAEVTGSFE